MDWTLVVEHLEKFAEQEGEEPLDFGQRASVQELADRIKNGSRAVLLADEVGMGKTRIAVALIDAVRRAGGRSAIVLPAGLGRQWQQELRLFNTDDKTLLPLRSYEGFIGGFLKDTDASGNNRSKKKHKRWLQNRRQQRALPENGWAAEKIVTISHAFANMRFPAPAEGPAGGWRRELFPNVARLCNGQKRYFIAKNFHPSEISYVHATRRAAHAISRAILENNLQCDLGGDHRWLEAHDYKRKILPLIGYGLGQFDLVVVDEAHKARGQDSSLSRILGPVTWESPDPFRLGMTATPVELDAKQWKDTLGRISGRDDGENVTGLEALDKWITDYVESVKQIRGEELDEALTEKFATVSKDFENALGPFVLRRDKRHDPNFQDFQNLHGDYRYVEDLKVSPEDAGFSRDWLRRFCAAEALSFLPQKDAKVKRARLSVAKGFGIGSFPDADLSENSEDSTDEYGPHSVWMDAFAGEPANIYTHPTILGTVKLIESYTSRGEKVLLFGRFIAPMDALTRLLDARELLRRLRDGAHWPAKTIPKKSEAAVSAAMNDPELCAPTGGIPAINGLLEERYSKWARERRTELARLHREINELAKQDQVAEFLASFIHRDDDSAELHGDIGALLEALSEGRDRQDDPWTGAELLGRFGELVKEISNDDVEENEGNNETKKADGDGLQGSYSFDGNELRSKLGDFLSNYSNREGNFARMMSGATGPQTRQLLQSAFNRSNSWPMVLLAQSRVGREGLNLHKACRTVVLFHAEWNPGIVEQQIGRVDRKGSRWLNDVDEWQKHGSHEPPPRIHIHPVVVSGTYDDHNWQVLKRRWIELRAQLHGDVLPHPIADAKASPGTEALRQQIKSATPSFAPKQLRDK